MYVSEVKTTAPLEYKNALQKEVYDTLQKLKIPFWRVETGLAVSMEDCIEMNKRLDMEMVKTLLLCNRQQTEFYLYIIPADKKFNAKEFSNALGIPRVEFAPANLFEEVLNTVVGAATIFSVLLDKDNQIKIVIDKQLTQDEWFGCCDGINTGFIKIQTTHILNDFLSYVKRSPIILEI